MVDVRDIQLKSKSLQETRRLSVSLPKHHRPGKEAPIIFCADGQELNAMSANQALLTEKRRVPPTVLVGVHSPPTYSAEEYLLGFNDKRFEAHERFFIEEVSGFVESDFGVTARPQARGVFGFSNGGAFAVSMGLRHSDTIRGAPQVELLQDT